jgi:hypothetical protein
MSEELDDLELMRLYLDDLPNPTDGKVFFQDYQLQKLIDINVDLYGAAAAGWRIKASRVSEWYNVNLDGAALTRSQAFNHAIQMARVYRDESSGEIFSVKLDNEFDTSDEESEMA